MDNKKEIKKINLKDDEKKNKRMKIKLEL